MKDYVQKNIIILYVSLSPRRSNVASTLICTAHYARPQSSNCSGKTRRLSVSLRSRPSIVHVWTLCLIVNIQEPTCSTFFFTVTRSGCKSSNTSICFTHTGIKVPSEDRISWSVMKVAEHLANRQGRML